MNMPTWLTLGIKERTERLQALAVIFEQRQSELEKITSPGGKAA
jgi:hypothetical protein